MTDRTALYLARDIDDALLYVGTSRHPTQRLRQHAKDKAWWPEVSRVEDFWFTRQWQAELAEQFFISRECPPHNRMMPPWRAPMPNEQCDLWCGWFDRTAERVFTALAAGDELESVARGGRLVPSLHRPTGAAAPRPMGDGLHGPARRHAR